VENVLHITINRL